MLRVTAWTTNSGPLHVKRHGPGGQRDGVGEGRTGQIAREGRVEPHHDRIHRKAWVEHETRDLDVGDHDLLEQARAGRRESGAQFAWRGSPSRDRGSSRRRPPSSGRPRPDARARGTPRGRARTSNRRKTRPASGAHAPLGGRRQAGGMPGHPVDRPTYGPASMTEHCNLECRVSDASECRPPAGRRSERFGHVAGLCGHEEQRAPGAAEFGAGIIIQRRSGPMTARSAGRAALPGRRRKQPTQILSALDSRQPRRPRNGSSEDLSGVEAARR